MGGLKEHEGTLNRGNLHQAKSAQTLVEFGTQHLLNRQQKIQGKPQLSGPHQDGAGLRNEEEAYV